MECQKNAKISKEHDFSEKQVGKQVRIQVRIQVVLRKRVMNMFEYRLEYMFENR